MEVSESIPERMLSCAPLPKRLATQEEQGGFGRVARGEEAPEGKCPGVGCLQGEPLPVHPGVRDRAGLVPPEEGHNRDIFSSQHG